MNIAITGASGHVGNNLCRELLKRGHHVKVLIHNFDKSLAGLDVEKVFGSILNKNVVNALVKDADYVFHTAAIISIGDFSRKEVGTINIFQIIRQVEKLFFLSYFKKFLKKLRIVYFWIQI